MPPTRSLQGRPLTAEEIEILCIVATHKGSDPLELAQIERRMLPHPLDESYLDAQEILIPGVDHRGRVKRVTRMLADDGVQVIRQNIKYAIEDLDRRIKTTANPREAERLNGLMKRVKGRLAAFPPLSRLTGEAEEEDAGAEGGADAAQAILDGDIDPESGEVTDEALDAAGATRSKPKTRKAPAPITPEQRREARRVSITGRPAAPAPTPTPAPRSTTKSRAAAGKRKPRRAS